MFGISASEFLLILIVAVLVIPARHWPAVFRGAAQAWRWLRGVVWNIRNKFDEISEEVSKYDPTDALSKQTMDDMMATFATPVSSRGAAKQNKRSRAKAKIEKTKQVKDHPGALRHPYALGELGLHKPKRHKK